MIKTVDEKNVDIAAHIHSEVLQNLPRNGG